MPARLIVTLFVNGRIKVSVSFEYNVSLVERLIPASDVSNEISMAGLRGQRNE